jgi:hypothetical protein
MFVKIINGLSPMELKSLLKRPKIDRFPKSLKLFHKFEILLEELSNKNLPEEAVIYINSEVNELNNSLSRNRTYQRDLRKSYDAILKYLKKELQMVPKHYHRNMWLAIGMSSFGIPLGIAFGLALDNMAFLGIGLPIGFAIGIAIGEGMDKKAKKEGKQLNVE